MLLRVSGTEFEKDFKMIQTSRQCQQKGASNKTPTNEFPILIKQRKAMYGDHCHTTVCNAKTGLFVASDIKMKGPSSPNQLLFAQSQKQSNQLNITPPYVTCWLV